jgi:hypothetical protein
VLVVSLVRAKRDEGVFGRGGPPDGIIIFVELETGIEVQVPWVGTGGCNLIWRCCLVGMTN